MKNKLDILKVIAYINVYGLDIFGTRYINLDCGKDNLSSYFVAKKNWSENRLKNVFSLLIKEGILNKEKIEVGMKFYKISHSIILKTQIQLLEVETV